MTIFETLFGKGRHSNAPTVGRDQRGQKKKYPALLSFLIRFYSFDWLEKLIKLPLRFLSVNISWKFITISLPFIKPTQKIPEEKKEQILIQPPDKLKVIKTYFVYILRSLKNGKYFIGTTDDLYGTFERHNSGRNIHTFEQKPFELIYYEACINYFDAKEREKYFSSQAGQKFLKKRLNRFLNHHQPSKIQRVLKIATFVSVQVLLLLIPTLLAIMYSPHQTTAAWFNENWSYRVSLTITHNAVVTNKKVKFDIDTATLITNGQMQSDCGDSRFTDNNGNLLPYFIDTAGGACNGASTDYYVLIPTVNNGTTVIYHYYGNPAAPDGTQTSQLPYDTLSPSGGAASAGSQEQSRGPIAYWKFDEGTDNTCKDGTSDACDSSTNTNNLSNIAAVWTTTDMCTSGSCMEFLGSAIGSQLFRSDDSDFDFVAADSFSMTGWFRHRPISSGTGPIIAKHSATVGGGYKIYMDSDGDLVCGIDDDNSWGPDASASTTNANYDDNTWHHFECVKDGTTSLTLYVDGQQVNQNTSISGVGSLANGHNFYIGVENDGPGYWDGFLDEIKIYRYARTSTQVKLDAAKGATLVTATAVMGTSSTDFLNKGLTGYWKMDESSWTDNCTTQSVVDSSGNDKHGIVCPFTSGPTSRSSGKFGLAGEFDGTDDYVEIANHGISLNNFTFAFWINPITAGAEEFIFSVNNGSPDNFAISIQNYDQLMLTIAGKDLIHNMNWVPGNFYHVVYTNTNGYVQIYVDGVLQSESMNVDTSGSDISSCPLSIGDTSDCGQFYEGIAYGGLLDDIRVYNRPLSPSEVTRLYTWAPGPVLLYKLDENTGTSSVFDSSGNGKTGTMNLFTNSAWKPGKYGSAIDFDGTTNFISVATPALPTKDFTYQAWVNLDDISDETIFEGFNGTADEFSLGVVTSGTPGRVEVTLNGTSFRSTNSITANAWHHLAVTRTGSIVRIYINGVLDPTTTTDGNVLDFSTCYLVLGADIDNSAGNCAQTGSNFANGRLDDMRVYNYARTPSQIIEDMNGGHPIGGSPIGSQLIYTKFDEMNGTTMNNSGYGGSSYNGTNTGAVWLPNTKCKVNGCIHFDTTTDNVNFTDISNVDGIASMSASLWINPQTLATTRSIVSKINTSPSNNFAVVTDSSNSDEIRIYIASSTSDTSNYFLTSDFNLSANSWQYLSFVYDGTLPAANRIKVFKNGRQVSGSVVGTIPLFTTNSSSSLFRLGDDEGTTHTSLLMYLDEFKFYPGALTQDQLLIDYNMGSAVNFNTGASLEASQSADTAGNPPLGHWNFDEGSGTTVKDISGNGHDGTITNPKNPIYVPGKFGSAVNFINAPTYVDMGNVTPLRLAGSSITLSGWVYPTSFAANQYIVRKRETGGAFAGRYELYVDTNGNASFTINTSGNTPTTVTGTSTLPLNKWTFVTGTLVPSTAQRVYVNGVQEAFTAITQGITATTGNFTIGANGFTNGSTVDEVKVYNYLRTPAQIAYDYNRGAPIGWWKFDECQGDVAYNASRLSNLNGTIDPNASGNTAVGTCTSGTATHMWNDGATGKFNSSLGFDATDDVVTVTNSTPIDLDLGLSSGLTFATWVYVNSDGEGDNGHILAKSDTTFVKVSGESGGLVTVDASLDQATDATVSVSTAMSTGAWHHVALSWTDDSDDEITLWIDGKARGTSTNGVGPPSSDTSNFFIGNRSAEDRTFDGQIDDIRVYNYELSNTQMNNVMNEGSGTRFGPITGSP